MLFFPDYKSAFLMSINVIKKYNLEDLPIDIFKLIDKFEKIKIEKYTNVTKKYNCSFEELIEHLNSDFGAIQYDEVYGNAVIYYNDTLNIQTIRFTIGHELGHYLLNHGEYAADGYIDKKILGWITYKNLDKETNCFSRNLLSPAPLVYLMNINNPIEIREKFNISGRAANTRIDLYKKYDKRYLTNNLINFFKDRFSFYVQYYNLKTCVRCQNRFYIAGAKYCPVCGHNEFKKLGEAKMIYSPVELDEKHKAVRCPQCDNENIPAQGEYCQICGKLLVNKCYGELTYDYNGNESGFIDGCGILASGEARYCCECGKQTTFGYFGLLKDWKEEQKEMKQSKKNTTLPLTSASKFGEIDEDDDLPF